jgi:hypothetical protein
MAARGGMTKEAIAARRTRVAELIFQGMTVEEMAAELGCGPATVKRDLRANRIRSLKEANALTSDRLGATAFANYQQRMRMLSDVYETAVSPASKIKCVRAMEIEERGLFDKLQRLGMVKTVPIEIRFQHSLYVQFAALTPEEQARVKAMNDHEFTTLIQQWVPDYLPGGGGPMEYAEDAEFEEINDDTEAA